MSLEVEERQMKPYVNIIVPIYNASKYLERCINSLLSQTMDNIEIVLVDDGSTDDSLAICKMYEGKDSRIKLFTKTNEGLGLTRNFGLALANGEYVAFVDSDDYVSPNMCQVLYDNAIKYNADIVYGDYSEDRNGIIVERKYSEKIEEWDQYEIRSLLLDFVATKPEEKNDTILPVSVWKGLFKLDTIKNNKISFVSERIYISEDVIFDIDILNVSKKVVYVPQNVYFYCLNLESLSKKYRVDRFEKEIVMYEEIVRKLKELDYNDGDIALRSSRFLIARARVDNFQILNSKESIFDQYKYVRSICNNSTMKLIFRNYPYKTLPLKYRIIVFLQKYHCISLLKLVANVNRISRGSSKC